MIHEFGSVVLVSFPFTDQTAAKKRPAVVVCSEAYQRQRPDLPVARCGLVGGGQSHPEHAPIGIRAQGGGNLTGGGGAHRRGFPTLINFFFHTGLSVH